jgi:hypothetical protein
MPERAKAFIQYLAQGIEFAGAIVAMTGCAAAAK